ncbi:MAG: hypothetical protein J6O09_03835 [Lachnospiraceae bacterium]|nr:hypothetical protein [Lachnospiraceae bacterium]
MVFVIAYIFFLYKDIREKKIGMIPLLIYALISLLTLVVVKDSITISSLKDMVFSIAFGLVIYLVSLFSDEGIGVADGIYFIINGLLLTLKENFILFLTGMLVAFIIGIFFYYFGNGKSRTESRIPFIPCFLPAIIGYIICIV